MIKKLVLLLSGVQVILFLANGLAFAGHSYILFSHPTVDALSENDIKGKIEPVNSLKLHMATETHALPDEMITVEKYALQITTASGYPVTLYFVTSGKEAKSFKESIEKGGIVVDISACKSDAWEEIEAFTIPIKKPLHPEIKDSELRAYDIHRRLTILRRKYICSKYNIDTDPAQAYPHARLFSAEEIPFEKFDLYSAGEDDGNYLITER